MLELFLIVAVSAPQPEPGYLIVRLQARQPVVILLEGQRIQPGRTYRTPRIYEPVRARLVWQFVDGDQIRRRETVLELSPGDLVEVTLTVHELPAEVLVRGRNGIDCGRSVESGPW